VGLLYVPRHTVCTHRSMW